MSETYSLKWAALFLIAFSLFYSTSFLPPRNIGDGLEYTLMLESLYNHYTPAIRATDVERFKMNVSKFQKWESIERNDMFDEIGFFVSYPKIKPMDERVGFYIDKNLKAYSYHFPFFPLLNIPAKIFLESLGLNQFYSFTFTNILFIVLTCYVILFTGRQGIIDYKSRIWHCLIFLFSPVFWYITWNDPSVYTSCLVFISLWFFFNERLYLAFFLAVLASLQNQPVAILTGFIGVVLLLKYKLSIRNIFLLLIGSFVTALPSVFYYIHFGIPNLVKYAGHLETKYITFTRVFGFFFDLNQGIVIGIPLLLITLVILFFYQVHNNVRLRRKFNIKWLLIAVVIGIAMTVSTMRNWNHGQAVVNRYAVWVSAMLIAIFIFVFEKYNWKKYFLPICATIQIMLIIYFGGINVPSYDCSTYKLHAKWVTQKYPSLYNPDPHIFAMRVTKRSLEPYESPIIFKTDDGKACKILVHQDDVKNIQVKKGSMEQLEKIVKSLDFINDWAYINGVESCENLDFKMDITKFEKKIDFYISTIKGSPAWYSAISEKAKEQNRNIEEVIREDAIYMVNTVGLK